MCHQTPTPSYSHTSFSLFQQGTYVPPPHIDEVTKHFIQICQQSAPLNPMKRSPRQYQASWKKMKEKTSSRELHFGHFKASSTNDIITAVNYILAELPFQTGYSPFRWRNATDVMILKKQGLYDIDKLRTIILYESDFNHNNKWLGKSMISHAIKFGKIAPEQYSIPGRKAIDHALNRRLVFDSVRYQKSSLALTSCDLKSCYDRIVHVPAMMAMNRAGTQPHPCKSMFRTIQSAQHITRTAFGDSNTSYGGMEGFNAPTMGVGQGNGCGPQVWAVISSVMFEVMKQRGLTTTFTLPISKDQLDLCGFAFVDDTDIFQATGKGKFYNDPEETMIRMQSAINCWEKAAKTTGGAIATDKSWYYLIHFSWEHGIWKYSNLDGLINDSLSCKDKSGNIHQLQYIPSNQAVEMLGVFLAPDGNNEKQVSEMIKKTSKLGELIRTGHLDHSEAWTALSTVAMKSLEYALPALTLTEEECSKIMWPLLRGYLPKMGVNRKFPRDVLYGNPGIQGMGLKNPFLTQGISHVSDISYHLWHKSLTGL